MQPTTEQPNGGATERHGRPAEVRFNKCVCVCRRDCARSNLDDWTVEVVEMRYSHAPPPTPRVQQVRGGREGVPHPARVARRRDRRRARVPDPTAMDIRSGRLLDNKDGFLKRAGSGARAHSWLGHRASFRMGLTEQSLPPPASLTFSMAEAYLYAPDSCRPARSRRATPLQRPRGRRPTPRSRSRFEALGSTVTCLQGPPGTGSPA